MGGKEGSEKQSDSGSVLKVKLTESAEIGRGVWDKEESRMISRPWA